MITVEEARFPYDTAMRMVVGAGGTASHAWGETVFRHEATRLAGFFATRLGAQGDARLQCMGVNIRVLQTDVMSFAEIFVALTNNPAACYGEALRITEDQIASLNQTKRQIKERISHE